MATIENRDELAEKAKNAGLMSPEEWVLISAMATLLASLREGGRPMPEADDLARKHQAAYRARYAVLGWPKVASFDGIPILRVAGEDEAEKTD